MKIADLMKNRIYHPSLMFYGALRTGKTAFLGQMGKRGMIFDFDVGYLTLASMQDKWTADRAEVEIESFFDHDWSKPTAYAAAHIALTRVIREHKTNPKYDVIAIDSFTGLAQSVRAFITANSNHAGCNPTRPEWGLILTEIENFMRLFKGFPGIKIVSGHEYFAETDDGSTRIKLLCPGKKLPMQILGFFDDVFYTKLKKLPGGKSDYILTSKATAAIECGSRTSFSGDYRMDDGLWNFLRLLKYDRKEGGE